MEYNNSTDANHINEEDKQKDNTKLSFRLTSVNHINGENNTKLLLVSKIIKIIIFTWFVFNNFHEGVIFLTFRLIAINFIINLILGMI